MRRPHSEMPNTTLKDAQNRLQCIRLRKWNALHSVYSCADGLEVRALRKTFVRKAKKIRNNRLDLLRQIRAKERDINRVAPVSGIMYRVHQSNRSLRLFVSQTEFDRSMSQIARAAKDIRTVISPSTVRKILDGAFEGTRLRSVILNEGLERLGGLVNKNKKFYIGVFSMTQIKYIVLPSTLKVLEYYTFYNCQ